MSRPELSNHNLQPARAIRAAAATLALLSPGVPLAEGQAAAQPAPAAISNAQLDDVFSGVFLRYRQQEIGFVHDHKSSPDIQVISSEGHTAGSDATWQSTSLEVTVGPKIAAQEFCVTVSDNNIEASGVPTPDQSYVAIDLEKGLNPAKDKFVSQYEFMLSHLKNGDWDLEVDYITPHTTTEYLFASRPQIDYSNTPRATARFQSDLPFVQALIRQADQVELAAEHVAPVAPDFPPRLTSQF